MRILQSTIERLLYVLLLLVFIAVIIVGGIGYHDGQQIKQLIATNSANHGAAIMRTEQQTQTIINNQKINSQALKDYIACLLKLNPSETPTQIQQAEQICFNNSPGVK